MHKDNDKIIMGIDPGTNIMGYGIIKVTPAGIKAIQLGVLHLSKYSNHAIKLEKIYERIIQLIKEYLPDEMAIEAPFYGKNVQSMLKLGRVQGVVIAAAISRDIPIVEYAPRKIKQVVTGNGNASKEQVARMLVQTISPPPGSLESEKRGVGETEKRGRHQLDKEDPGEMKKKFHGVKIQRGKQVTDSPIRPFNVSGFDATDALAVAVCHYYKTNTKIKNHNSKQSWESFIKENPGRIK